MTTFRQAYLQACEGRWRGVGQSTTTQGSIVARYFTRRRVEVEQVTKDHVRDMVAHFTAKGNAPSTINRKLSALGVLTGKPMEYLPEGRKRKWWLPPEAMDQLCAWLRETQEDDLADFIKWTAHTGLRTFESLAVTRSLFVGLGTDTASLTVPGTKTEGSQRHIALDTVARELAARRLEHHDHLFTLTYRQLRLRWFLARERLGEDGKLDTCTLKALRRTFARLRADDGMPVDMLQTMLGHGDVHTTMGYLNVVGGDSVERQRRWLR